MKSTLKVLGAIVLVLIVAAIVIPFIFKDEIKELVKNSTNESLNAQVNFTDVDLSLFSSFPNLSVSIDDLTVINKSPFEGDTVFSANSISATVDIISLIQGNVLKINSIHFDSPKAIIYVLEDGSTNYNLMKEDSSVTESTPVDGNEEVKFNIDLQNYSITNARLAYIDQTSDMLVAINNLNHSGNGDFSQDDFILDTKTTIDEFTVEMGGVKYLNKVKSTLDMELGINVPNMKFTFKENELGINNLVLKFDGSIEMPDDDISMDLTFSSPRSEFKDIISLIPAIYKNDFSNIETSGKMELAGKLKGTLSENSLPSFDIKLNVNDGNLKYPDLPTPINNVNLALNVSNPNGVIDNTVVNLSNIHMELGSEPIDGRMIIKNPESGPNVDLKVKGNIDLGNLKNALDLQDISQLAGTIKSDFELKGNIASASSNYENIDAKGNLSVANLIYKGKDFNQKISVSNASLKFNPKNISLNNFDAKIGESDISANGSLKNLISFVMSDGILVGNLNLNSNYFDFNPYLTEEEIKETDESSGETPVVAFDVPENINFIMKSNFKKLIYDNLELTNVTGQITIKESKVNLNDLNMNLLQGSMSGSGYYAKTKYQENPDIKFDLDVKDFNIKQTYDNFVSVAQFAPIAKYIIGSFSSKLSMNTSLDNSMMPKWETFFSNGLLNLKTAEVKGFKPFTTVGSLLNMQELSNPKLQNVKPSFEIKNGRFYVKPFNYKIGNYDVVLSGSNGIDQSLDYVMEIDVPAEKLKSQANNAISGLLGKNVNLVKSGTVKVKALIGGTIDSPNVKTSAADVASSVVKEVTTAVVDEAKAQVDKAKADAEKKLKAEAKKKEEELKKKLEEEAKKKLKKLFKWG